MEELKKLLKKFEDENRIEDYNRLYKILSDEHVEIVDVLHKEDEIQVFCNDTFEEVPFLEVFKL